MNKNLFIKTTLTLAILCCLLASTKAEKKLIFVQELFRHGARYPIYPKTEDHSMYAVEENSVGELTTQGKNMHYQLGKKIYQKYWKDLFEGTQFQSTYNQSKFYIKSTDVNRTIESCQSHLMGIFENLSPLQIGSADINFSRPLWPDVDISEGPVFPNALPYHPLPIHVEKSGSNYVDSGDFLRAYSPENCPNQDVWQNQNALNKDLEHIFKDKNIVEAINALSKSLGKTATFQNVGKYYDNFKTSEYLGRDYLDIFTDSKYGRALEYIYIMDLYINLFYTQTQRRTTSSGFFQNTLANIKRAKQQRDVQWVIYSAHDTTVGNMLAAMNMTNVDCIYEAFTKNDDNYNADKCVIKYPGYTASIIFEVYENSDTQVDTFQIRYEGVHRKIPFCNYELECPVHRLQEWYNQSIKIDSFAANCGLVNEEKQTYLGLAMIELGIIIAMGIGYLVKELKSGKKVQVNASSNMKESLISCEQINEEK